MGQNHLNKPKYKKIIRFMSQNSSQISRGFHWPPLPSKVPSDRQVRSASVREEACGRMETVAAGGTPSRHGNLLLIVTMATCSPKNVEGVIFSPKTTALCEIFPPLSVQIDLATLV